MILSNKVYDVIKVLAILILPALATLYFTIAQIWGLPMAEQVIGTITAITTFLGVIARLSSGSYQKDPSNFDGIMNVVTKEDGGKVYDLSLHGDPETLQDQKVVTFKVDARGEL